MVAIVREMRKAPQWFGKVDLTPFLPACCAPAAILPKIMGLARTFAVSTSLLASQLRGWRGTSAFRPASRQPEKLLELYDYEDCPYCRLVREVLTELDLDAIIYPCPRGGRRFRPRAKELGGKFQFPLLVDPNTGRQLYESADIIAYLRETYGGHTSAPKPLDRALKVASSSMATLVRGRHGWRARPSKSPAQPLELYSFESSPFSRLVREVLCELELPYRLRNTGKGRWTDMGPASVRDQVHKAPKDTGRNRKALFERTGHVQVPYLIDPNTETEMFESADIIRYLEKTYGA
jgi:glutathione S-transferase